MRFPMGRPQQPQKNGVPGSSLVESRFIFNKRMLSGNEDNLTCSRSFRLEKLYDLNVAPHSRRGKVL